MAKEGLKAVLARHLQSIQRETRKEQEQTKAEQRQRERKAHTSSTLRTVFHWSDGSATNIPFRPNSTVLVLGDGDFSFCAALSGLLSNNAHIIATVRESESELLAIHKSAERNVEALRNCPNVQSVQYSVDAGSLQAFAKEAIEVVVFNFPHTGTGIKDKDRNVLSNQKLLQRFFKAANSVLAGQQTHTVSLSVKSASRPGEPVIQSSRPMEPMVLLTLWCGEPYESWRPKQLARAHGLDCVASFRFDFDLYPGYKHCRTDGRAEPEAFTKKPAKTFLFTLRKQERENKKKKKNKNTRKAPASDSE